MWYLQNNPKFINHSRRRTTTTSNTISLTTMIIIPSILILCFWTQLATVQNVRNGVKICLNNCGQCKRMFGQYFEGRRCADTCVQAKGLFIPDCQNINSIENFITKNNN